MTRYLDAIPEPWSVNDIRSAILHKIGEARRSIDDTAGGQLWAALEELSDTVWVFQESADELFQVISLFADRTRDPGFWDEANRINAEHFCREVKRKLFNCTTSVMALVEVSRTFNKKWPVTGYDEKVRACFATPGLHRFLQDLRNYNSHRRIVEVNWVINYDFKRGSRVARFVVGREDLLSWGGWKAEAKKFIDDSGDNVDVGATLFEYKGQVKSFYEWHKGAVLVEYAGSLHPRNYGRNIKKIEGNGFEDNVIPGLKLTLKKWSGLGIVVPDLATPRRVQYDVLTLIDQGLVSDAQFDHILVCDQLPATLEGLDEQALHGAFSNACFDFKSCRAVPLFEAGLAAMDFSTRLIVLEGSTASAPQHERGGCWLWFEGNSHPYVRKLVQAGRVKPNNKGRYLASLDELDTKRDLRERQEIVLALSQQLREKYGVKSSYFSVKYSYSPDDDPAYAGRIWGGGYFITDAPDEDDDE